VCLYRLKTSKKSKHPISIFYEDFSALVESLIAKENSIILGDFNIHFDNKHSTVTKKLIEIIKSNNLHQFVDTATQKFGHTLDWVISQSHENKCIKSVVVEDYQISDHFVQTIITDLSRPKRPLKYVTCRNIKGIDPEKFRDDLLSSTLITDPPKNVDNLVNLYNKTLSNLIDKHAPLKEKLVVDRPCSAWFGDNVRAAKEERRLAENNWRKSGLEIHRQIYKNARNKYTNTVRQAKSQYIQTQLSESAGNPKKTFDIVNSLLNKDNTSPILPDVDRKTAADSLSSYFIEKIASIQESFKPSEHPLSDNEDNLHVIEPNFIKPFSGSDLCCLSTVDEDILKKVIARSKKTTCELDPAPTYFLLQFLDTLLPTILNIINLSIVSGIVPSGFKTAIVKPLLKKSGLDPAVFKNYRPVSNLPYVSKLLERVVADQLIVHLNDHDCLDKFQSAYRPGFSTETALLRVTNDILTKINSGNLVLLLLLDLSAAFDTIDHNLLLERLSQEVGIKGLALQWFKSYLIERTQTVVVSTSKSSPETLACGVPQGSVLGPILFSLYTSQLGKLIGNFGIQRHFYADDSQLYNSFPPDPIIARKEVKRLEECCIHVKSWMIKNRLKLNDSKTEAILCGSKAKKDLVRLENIQVGDASILLTESVRDLGLIIDSDLCMTEHITSVLRKCHYQLHLLSKLRPMLTQAAAISIALATIISRLDYCNSTLWGLPSSQLHRLQKVQNTAARIVTRTKKTDHISPVLKSLHWLPIHYRIDYKILCLAYNCWNKTSPLYLQEEVSVYKPSRDLRSISDFRFSLPARSETNKKNSGARSFKNSAPALWNDLPRAIKCAESINIFRKKLKTHLFT